MRDLVAGVVALLLLLAAASLATTLRYYRRRRNEARESESERGRIIICEIPAGADLMLFSEDRSSFHLGERIIDKATIQAVRVLINGSPIARYDSLRAKVGATPPVTGFDDRPEGIERDRWDVAIDTETGTVMVECGSIRERVSQELARKTFDAVKAAVERRDAAPRV